MNPTREPSPQTRALHNPVVRACLLRQADPSDIAALRLVDRAFNRLANTPDVWAMQFWPASVDVTTRTIVQHLLPLRPHGAHNGYRCLDEHKGAQRRVLHRPCGDLWTLVDGPGFEPSVDEPLYPWLDQVTVWHMFGHSAGRLGLNDKDVPQQLLTANRPHAYAFLLRRGYQLRQGFEPAPLSLAAKGIWAIIVGAACISMWHHAHRAVPCHSPSAAQVPQKASELCDITLLTLLGLLYGLVRARHGEAALRCAWQGPAHSLWINHWAEQALHHHEMSRP